jgi:hypothetical protein
MRSGVRRWWGLGAVLVLAVLAIQWVDSGEAPPAREATLSEPVAPAEATRGASPGATSVPVVSEIRLDRLRREPYPALKSDPFKGDFALDPMSSPEAFEGGGAAQRSSGPPPPPPVPFTYMGKMLEDGETVVFLTRGDRNYVVRKGATLDGQYRVDAIGPRTMVLTYLPAKAKQSLAIGSAP